MSQELSEDTETEVGFIDGHPHVAMALGIFIARWSLAEFALNLVLEHVAKADQNIVLGLMAATPSAEGKIRLVRIAVIQSTLTDVEKLALTKALKKLNALCDERNSICHHTWGTSDKKYVTTWDYRHPPGLKLRHKFRDQYSINQLSNRVVQAACEIAQAFGSSWLTPRGAAELKLPESEP